MPKKFWAFEGGDGEPNALRLEGPISEETWWGDEVTPEQFRAELAQHPGDLMVYINSPGGDVVAGSLIYSMLKEHNGRVTVRIDGLAASAASVVAMAGDRVEMAPTAYMMIHNAATIAMGDNREMRRAADMLDEVNRGIRSAYALKTGKGERELARMMDDETWMSAATAVQEGFADAVCYAPEPQEGDGAGTAQEGAQAAQTAAQAASAATSAATSADSFGSLFGDGLRRGLAAMRPAAAYQAKARRNDALPPVIFAACRLREITAQAAVKQATQAVQDKHPTNEAETARTRLRLLSM